MILNFPQGFDRQKFHLPGQVENMGGRVWEWRPAEGVLITAVIGDGSIEIDDATDQAYVDILQAALDATAATEPEWSGLFRQVRQAANSAVGVALTDLTNAQIKALLAVLLFEKKAVDQNGKVRPLAEWVRRRV